MDTYIEETFIGGSGYQPLIGQTEDNNNNNDNIYCSEHIHVMEHNVYLWDSTNSPSYSNIHNQTSTYQDNRAYLLNWDGQDCMMFAQNVVFSNGIESSRVDIKAFRYLTGADLASYSRQDFSNLVGEQLATTFFEELRRIQENEGIGSNNPELVNMVTVPEGNELYDEDYSLTDLTQSVPALTRGEDDSILEANIDISGTVDLINLPDPCDLNFLTEFKVDEYLGNADLIEDVIPAQVVPELFAQEPLGLEPFVPLSTESCPSPVLSPSPVPSPPPTVDKRSKRTSRSRRSRHPSRLRRTPSPTPSEASSVGSIEDVLRRVRTTSRKRERGPKNYEYLMRLLHDSEYNPRDIRWEDEDDMTFRIVKPSHVAHIWGQRSNKPNLTYDNFARGLRYHYKTGALEAVSERQLVYRCGPLAIEYLKSLGYGRHQVHGYPRFS